MDTSRRKFLQTGAIGVATTVAAPITFSNSKAEPKAAVSQVSISDPTVSKRTGPFGQGLPITMAGYEYNRVRALVEGKVTVEGCASQFEVTSIDPLNNHAFFGPKTRDVTEIGLIPYILAYCNDEFRDYQLLPIPIPIPIPILHTFRHKSIFIRTDRGIKTPADLRGRKAATVGYLSSGLTHVRGILQEQYGINPNEIEWVAVQRDSAANLRGAFPSG